MEAKSRSQRAVVQRMGEECLAIRTRMIARAVTAIYDDEFRDFGIKASQLNVLTTVAYAGPARRAEIGRTLHMDASTLTRNLRPLFDAGLIESTAGGDRRGAPIRISTAGARLIVKVAPAWERAQMRTRDLLGATAASATYATAERLWAF